MLIVNAFFYQHQHQQQLHIKCGVFFTYFIWQTIYLFLIIPKKTSHLYTQTHTAQSVITNKNIRLIIRHHHSSIQKARFCFLLLFTKSKKFYICVFFIYSKHLYTHVNCMQQSVFIYLFSYEYFAHVFCRVIAWLKGTNYAAICIECIQFNANRVVTFYRNEHR